MNISEAGLALIKKYEGFSALPYQCAGGRWTIGYGSTDNITASHPPVTLTQADIMLRHDILTYERAVNTRVNVPLTQHQFDALVSFTYNLGEHNLAKSTLLRKLNALDYEGAAQEFHRWNKADGKTLKGLTRRRKAESELFLKPLAKSRTLAASTAGSVSIVGTAGIDALQHSVNELSSQLQLLVEFSDYLKWAFITCSLVSFGIVAYARIDDYRKGIR